MASSSFEDHNVETKLGEDVPKNSKSKFVLEENETTNEYSCINHQNSTSEGNYD